MANEGKRDAVTGAFGFTGRAIAGQLLAAGREVVTLSRRSGAGDPLEQRVRAERFEPDGAGAPERIEATLRGVDVLYNTYWLRFARAGMTYERAVAHSATLLAAARRAGVRRVVHVSVVNASADGPTPYVRAKAALEAVVRGAGMEWAIVRPTLTFGPADILLNNLAWALRRLPVYGIPGRGRYTVQPVHVEDVARICLEAAAAETGRTVDAAGPEVLGYRDLVEAIRGAIGSRSVIVPMPASLVLTAARVLGLVVGDVVLTRDEVLELTTSFLTSAQAPLGTIRVSDWIREAAPTLGRSWASELRRNYSPPASASH